MATQGVELVCSIEELSVVGFFEVLASLPRIKRAFNRILREAKDRRPSAAVLIDSPDFNLRLARKLKVLSIPVLYYISPTVWAWRAGRLRTIRKNVDKMLLIFPFEKEIYGREGIPAAFVGHPLLEKVKSSLSREDFLAKHGFDPEKKLITFLPGSRRSELKRHLPVLVKAASLIRREFPVQFALVKADSLDRSYLDRLLPSNNPEIRVIDEDGYEAMAASVLILSACGTANMEACLLETPLIAFYRISPLTFYPGVRLLKIKHYSIVNIIAGKKVVPELIQGDFKPERLCEETRRLLLSAGLRAEQVEEFRKVKKLLGEERASENAACELERLIFYP